MDLNLVAVLPVVRDTIWFWSESSKDSNIAHTLNLQGWHLGHWDGYGWRSSTNPTWSETGGPVRFWLPLGLPDWSEVQRALGAHPHV